MSENETQKEPVFTNDESEVNGIFREKKKRSVLLSESYFRLQRYKQSEHVRDCGTTLSFRHELDRFGVVDEHGKLYRANFCRDRLCPMCNWRRSFKIFAQISQIMDRIWDKYKFLFLTLTVRNPSADDLIPTLKQMQQGWSKLRKLKDFKKVVKGTIKTMEITYNDDPLSPAYGTYHPHYHVILAVPKSYGYRGKYIDQSEWLQMWRNCYGDQEITQLFIEVIKPKKEYAPDCDLRGAILETAKYAVKDSDYIKNDPQKTDQLVDIFATSLFRRRLFEKTGVFLQIARELDQEDPEGENADLIHINELVSPAIAHLITRYDWQVGVYRMIDSYVVTES